MGVTRLYATTKRQKCRSPWIRPSAKSRGDRPPQCRPICPGNTRARKGRDYNSQDTCTSDVGKGVHARCEKSGEKTDVVRSRTPSCHGLTQHCVRSALGNGNWMGHKYAPPTCEKRIMLLILLLMLLLLLVVFTIDRTTVHGQVEPGCERLVQGLF